MLKSTISPEVIEKGKELIRIGNRGVRAAQEENRRLGIPNVYSIDGIIYYELPNGELSRTDPYPDGVASADSSNKSSHAPSPGPSPGPGGDLKRL